MKKQANINQKTVEKMARKRAMSDAMELLFCSACPFWSGQGGIEICQRHITIHDRNGGYHICGARYNEVMRLINKEVVA